MKRSKLFLAAGTFVLAITALLSTKANKKFSGVATGFFDGSSSYYVTNLSSLNLTTQTGTGYYPVFLSLKTGTVQHLKQQLVSANGNGLYRFD